MSVNVVQGATLCKKCPLGTAVETPGEAVCAPCAEGYFADEEGMQQCEKCVNPKPS